MAIEVTRIQMQADPTDPRHGTFNGYINLRCRCTHCRAANTEAHRAYMDRHPEQQEKNRVRTRQRSARVALDRSTDDLRADLVVARRYAESYANKVRAIEAELASRAESRTPDAA